MKRTPLKKISKKRLAKLGGKTPFSTISGVRKPLKRSTKRIVVKGRRRFPKGEDREYLAWIRTLLCAAGREGRPLLSCSITAIAFGGSEAAHVRSKGAGGHDKGNTVPLCSAHHREQHTIGIRSFCHKYSVDLKQLATDYASRYEREHPNG